VRYFLKWGGFLVVIWGFLFLPAIGYAGPFDDSPVKVVPRHNSVYDSKSSLNLDDASLAGKLAAIEGKGVEKYIELVKSGDYSSGDARAIVSKAIDEAKNVTDFVKLSALYKRTYFQDESEEILMKGLPFVKNMNDLIELSSPDKDVYDWEFFWRDKILLAGLPLAKNLDDILAIARAVEYRESLDKVLTRGLDFVKTKDDVLKLCKGVDGTRWQSKTTLWFKAKFLAKGMAKISGKTASKE